MLPRCLFVLFLAATPLSAQDKKPTDKLKEVAGTSEFLRSVPKHFATLTAIDRVKHRVTLQLEGEKTAKEWPLIPDAEIKRDGWWARLDQFQPGERVWVWMYLDRVKKPTAIMMLCDGLTEQDIHGPSLIPGDVATAEFYKGNQKVSRDAFQKEDKVYVVTAQDGKQQVLDQAAFDLRQEKQKEVLRSRWLAEGLPGTATFLHVFGGEMDLMLDHEAMRWGRSLQYGDTVTLSATPPIEAAVKSVKPWRERTQLRLVVRGHDLTDLKAGQRIFLRMKAPAAEVESSPFPPDLDRPRTKEERIEWFLASVYCPCLVKGDGCTGDFYTLASCNVNACGMPNVLRDKVRDKINQGKTDRQIFEELLKQYGRDLTRPHLLK